MAKLRLPFKIKAKISQNFGNKLIINGKNIYGQWSLLGHNGLDFGLPNDTPIYSPHDGRILENAYDKNGYGWYIKIESKKEGSVLAHNRRFVVKIGDDVKKGELVGYSDNSGFSTGSHLHWGYYRLPRNRKNGYNGYIDQTPYLKDNIEQFLISKGYTYPKAHLDVVKAMYQSDLKLKSGKYIIKDDYSKTVEELSKKQIARCKIEKKEAVDNAIKECAKEDKVKFEKLEKKCEEMRNTTAYKIAESITKALQIIKEKYGRHSTRLSGKSKGSGK